MDKNLRIQIVLNAVGNAIRPLTAIRRESAKASKALKETRERLKVLQGVRSNIAGFRKLETQTVELAMASRKASAEARRLHDAYLRTASPTKALGKAMSIAGEQAAKADAAHRKASTDLAELQRKLQGAGVDTARLVAHEERLGHEIAEANGQLHTQKARLAEATAAQKRYSQAQEKYRKARDRGAAISGGGLRAVGAGTAMAAPLILATKASIEFEAHMANLRKIIDFPTPKAFQAFSGALMDSGVRLGINPTGMADIAAQGAMGGVPRDELLKFSRDAALMKEAMNFEDAKQAGEMAAGWRHAFNLRQEQVHELGDVITGLTRKWGAKSGNGAEVGTIVANVGTLSQVAGAGRKETAALAAVLSSMNIDSGVASTGIRNLMINLTRGAGAARNQRKGFEALGLDAKVMAQAMQKDAGGAIMLVLDRIRQLPKAAQTGVLTQLFGARSIGPIGSLLERFDRVKEALGFVGNAANYTGQMELEFKRKTDTTAFALEQAKGNAEALAVTVGNVLNPTIRQMATGLAPVLKNLTTWARNHPALVRTLAIGAAVLAGLVIIVGALAIAIGSILAPIALLNLAWTQALPLLLGLTAGFLELAAALLVNPITWIVLAFVALAGAAYLVWKNWKPITAWFGSVWDGVRQKIGGFVDWAGGIWMRFADMGAQMVIGLINGISGKLADLKKAIAGMGDQVATWFKQRLGIHSPSRLFAELGGFTIDGFILGIDQGSRRLEQRVTTLASRVGEVMHRGLHKAGGLVAHVLGGRGPLGLRLNNPGNLRHWGDAPTAHGFAAFQTLGDGFRAMARQLQLYATRDHRDTVASIVRRWAPPSENRTGAYIDAVTRRTGFGANQHLNLGSPAVMAALVAAMATQEQGRSPLGVQQLQALLEAKPPPLHFASSRPVRAAGGGSAAAALPPMQIHVHAAPGHDPQQLAELVASHVGEAMRRHAAKHRPSKSSFDDVDGD